MFKIAIERAEIQACLGYPEREQFGAKLNAQCSMFKIAIERAESRACLGYPEREQFGAKLNVQLKRVELC